MNKILKFPWHERHRHFFTSDWHIFHDPKWDVPLWQARGYTSASDAVGKILNKINERVGPDDILWVLGDLFLNATDEQCVGWMNSISCRNIYKLWGNHHSNTYRIYKEELEKTLGLTEVEVYPAKFDRIQNLTFVGNQVDVQIGKQYIVMNHFPVHSWNKMGGGKSWMLSGHQHNSDKTRNPICPINRCLDVGWDWKKDVWSFNEVEDVMSTKTFVAYDHHKNTVH